MGKNFRNNKFSKDNEQKEFDDQIEGRNAVLELLESGKDINKIYITKGEKHGSITKIIAKAKERKIVTVEVEREKINQMAQTENAQGVIAIVPPFDYCEVEDILNEAKSKNEKAFILILDGIEDPHNLGSIIRTAETAGVHGIIIPKRRAAAVNSTVVKTSAGATSFMKVARVNNINETIKYLKENNIKEELNDTHEDTPLILSEAKEEPKEIVKELPKQEIIEPKELEKVEEVKEEIKEEKIPVNTNNNGLYTKNVLREKRVQTSPIHIDRELSSREELPKEDYHTNEDILTGIDLHEDALSPLETMEDAYEVNDNMKFASDIVERMEEEIKPSNIELTDYERKQEEEAIISYDELLKVKDKIYNITDDEETDEFIDELKNFRIDLQ